MTSFDFLEGAVAGFAVIMGMTILFPVASALGDRFARYIRGYADDL